MMQDVHLPEAQQNLSRQEFGIQRRHEHRSTSNYDNRKRI
jgi:hypothetical protein